MSMKSTYTPDMSKILGKIDTFWKRVDEIDMKPKHVENTWKNRHILETCR